MPKNESHFHVAAEVENERRPAKGVTDKILSYDEDTQNITILQIYEPGWKQPHGTYTHDYWEEIFVISGKIYDHTIKRWVHAGEYACRPPGQLHGPFECAPEAGASVLLTNTKSWAGKK